MPLPARNSTDNLPDDEVMMIRQSSQRREPHKLAYFHGQMPAHQANRWAGIGGELVT